MDIGAVKMKEKDKKRNKKRNKMGVFLEINKCSECPNCTVTKDYTEDSWDDCRRYDCKKEEKNIARWVDWNEEGPDVPEWCPSSKNNGDLAGKFTIWLTENRWFNFKDGKWRYTFEHGTAISKVSYEKNYTKTNEELYAIFYEQLKKSEK